MTAIHLNRLSSLPPTVIRGIIGVGVGGSSEGSGNGGPASVAASSVAPRVGGGGSTSVGADMDSNVNPNSDCTGDCIDDGIGGGGGGVIEAAGGASFCEDAPATEFTHPCRPMEAPPTIETEAGVPTAQPQHLESIDDCIVDDYSSAVDIDGGFDGGFISVVGSGCRPSRSSIPKFIRRLLLLPLLLLTPSLLLATPSAFGMEASPSSLPSPSLLSYDPHRGVDSNPDPGGESRGWLTGWFGAFTSQAETSPIEASLIEGGGVSDAETASYPYLPPWTDSTVCTDDGADDGTNEDGLYDPANEERDVCFPDDSTPRSSIYSTGAGPALPSSASAPVLSTSRSFGDRLATLTGWKRRTTEDAPEEQQQLSEKEIPIVDSADGADADVREDDADMHDTVHVDTPATTDPTTPATASNDLLSPVTNPTASSTSGEVPASATQSTDEDSVGPTKSWFGRWLAGGRAEGTTPDSSESPTSSTVEEGDGPIIDDYEDDLDAQKQCPAVPSLFASSSISSISLQQMDASDPDRVVCYVDRYGNQVQNKVEEDGKPVEGGADASTADPLDGVISLRPSILSKVYDLSSTIVSSLWTTGKQSELDSLVGPSTDAKDAEESSLFRFVDYSTKDDLVDWAARVLDRAMCVPTTSPDQCPAADVDEDDRSSRPMVDERVDIPTAEIESTIRVASGDTTVDARTSWWQRSIWRAPSSSEKEVGPSDDAATVAEMTVHEPKLSLSTVANVIDEEGQDGTFGIVSISTRVNVFFVGKPSVADSRMCFPTTPSDQCTAAADIDEGDRSSSDLDSEDADIPRAESEYVRVASGEAVDVGAPWRWSRRASSLPALEVGPSNGAATVVDMMTEQPTLSVSTVANDTDEGEGQAGTFGVVAISANALFANFPNVTNGADDERTELLKESITEEHIDYKAETVPSNSSQSEHCHQITRSPSQVEEEQSPSTSSSEQAVLNPCPADETSSVTSDRQSEESISFNQHILVEIHVTVTDYVVPLDCSDDAVVVSGETASHSIGTDNGWMVTLRELMLPQQQHVPSGASFSRSDPIRLEQRVRPVFEDLKTNCSSLLDVEEFVGNRIGRATAVFLVPLQRLLLSNDGPEVSTRRKQTREVIARASLVELPFGNEGKSAIKRRVAMVRLVNIPAWTGTASRGLPNPVVSVSLNGTSAFGQTYTSYRPPSQKHRELDGGNSYASRDSIWTRGNASTHFDPISSGVILLILVLSMVATTISLLAAVTRLPAPSQQQQQGKPDQMQATNHSAYIRATRLPSPPLVTRDERSTLASHFLPQEPSTHSRFEGQSLFGPTPPIPRTPLHIKLAPLHHEHENEDNTASPWQQPAQQLVYGGRETASTQHPSANNEPVDEARTSLPAPSQQQQQQQQLLLSSPNFAAAGIGNVRHLGPSIVTRTTGTTAPSQPLPQQLAHGRQDLPLHHERNDADDGGRGIAPLQQQLAYNEPTEEAGMSLSTPSQAMCGTGDVACQPLPQQLRPGPEALRVPAPSNFAAAGVGNLPSVEPAEKTVTSLPAPSQQQQLGPGPEALNFATAAVGSLPLGSFPSDDFEDLPDIAKNEERSIVTSSPESGVGKGTGQTAHVPFSFQPGGALYAPTHDCPSPATTVAAAATLFGDSPNRRNRRRQARPVMAPPPPSISPLERTISSLSPVPSTGGLRRRRKRVRKCEDMSSSSENSAEVRALASNSSSSSNAPKKSRKPLAIKPPLRFTPSKDLLSASQEVKEADSMWSFTGTQARSSRTDSAKPGKENTTRAASSSVGSSRSSRSPPSSITFAKRQRIS